MIKQRKRTPLVVEHLEGISRAAISRFPELVTEFARGKSGVYALYKRTEHFRRRADAGQHRLSAYLDGYNRSTTEGVHPYSAD